MKSLARIITLVACMAVPLAALAVNEITTGTSLRVVKGYVSLDRIVSGVQTTWTNSQLYGPITYSVTQTWTAVTAGGITNLGWVHMRNTDTTNSVYVSFDSGTNAVIELAPGESALWRFRGPFPIGSMAIKSAANGSNTLHEITIISK